MKSLLRTLTGLILIAVSVSAQTEKPIVLPRPQTDGGKPLMQVLKERQSGREFSSEKLPPQLLSNLLWAAWGVNRPDGRRTAPSASNRQEIDIYVATPEGLYLYNATDHQLQPLVKEDLRAATGRQPYVGQAALNLIYVADQTRMGRPDDSTAFADTGFISQNVYLFCASEGLATVVRGSVDRESLSKLMKLRPDQKITLAQTVGYPKK